MRKLGMLLIPLALVAAGCAGGAAGRTDARPRPQSASPTAPADEAPSSGSPAMFRSAISVIDEAARERMPHSWHRGCPIGFQDLRLLRISHWGFDGKVHGGELVVHRDVSRDVVTAFAVMFQAGYPVRRMRLVDAYDGDDERSMAANNTSAFNCREVTGHPGVWSEHSYGRAIDINPLNNPYVAGGTILPSEGAGYADRSMQAEGMIHDGDAVVRAFASIGWEWGGHWSSVKDYQHFSASGR